MNAKLNPFSFDSFLVALFPSHSSFIYISSFLPPCKLLEGTTKSTEDTVNLAAFLMIVFSVYRGKSKLTKSYPMPLFSSHLIKTNYNTLRKRMAFNLKEEKLEVLC